MPPTGRILNLHAAVFDGQRWLARRFRAQMTRPRQEDKYLRGLWNLADSTLAQPIVPQTWILCRSKSSQTRRIPPAGKIGPRSSCHCKRIGPVTQPLGRLRAGSILHRFRTSSENTWHWLAGENFPSDCPGRIKLLTHCSSTGNGIGICLEFVALDWPVWSTVATGVPQ